MTNTKTRNNTECTGLLEKTTIIVVIIYKIVKNENNKVNIRMIDYINIKKCYLLINKKRSILFKKGNNMIKYIK
jgi:hypothetical protein